MLFVNVPSDRTFACARQAPVGFFFVARIIQSVCATCPTSKCNTLADSCLGEVGRGPGGSGAARGCGAGASRPRRGQLAEGEGPSGVSVCVVPPWDSLTSTRERAALAEPLVVGETRSPTLMWSPMPPAVLAVTAEGASCAARAVPSGSVSCMLAARRVQTDRFPDGVPAPGESPAPRSGQKRSAREVFNDRMSSHPKCERERCY